MSLWFARARAASVLALALGLALGLATTAPAQGLQTSTLSGTVSSADGAVLPGATVTLTSPALQGERHTTTDANGNYIFRGLPGGTYKVAFSLSGFGTVERDVTIALGTTAQRGHDDERGLRHRERHGHGRRAVAPQDHRGGRQLQGRRDRQAGHRPHHPGHRRAGAAASPTTRPTPARSPSPAPSPTTTCSCSTASTSTTTSSAPPTTSSSRTRSKRRRS